MKKVTLTFDNGPTPGITEGVLAILRSHGIKATFFVVGENLHSPLSLKLLDEIAADGHNIGTHTLTHSVALGENPSAAYAALEIGEPQAVVGERNPARLFRPYGNLGLIGPHLFSENALQYLLDNRYTCVLWNSVPHDWDDPENWVERCVKDVSDQDWTVVVLHDIEDAASGRLDELIRRLEAMHVSFVQDFPEDVVVTCAGRTISLKDSYVAGRT